MPEKQPQEPQILTDSNTPANVNRTSDYAIAAEARDAYAAVMVETLDRADDTLIALEIRLRPADESTERTELDDFLREQGFEPVELGA